MPFVLLATCADLPDGDEDAGLLVEALERVGVTAEWVVWGEDRRPGRDADLVVLRSTWDYTPRRDEFVGWVAGLPEVANGADLVVWSSDKTYLADLARAGVPTVPSTFAAPGDAVAFPGGEFVVKPSVGAGSRGAGRFTADRLDDARRHVAALHDAGRTALVQPYLAGVDTAGETALLYFDGRFSHAIRKGAMLPAGFVHPVAGDSLFVPENITPRVPSAAELAVGAQALAVLTDRFGAEPLYARVDLLPGPAGPVVTELELVEPSLFLAHAAGAADRFAAAVAARCAGPTVRPRDLSEVSG